MIHSILLVSMFTSILIPLDITIGEAGEAGEGGTVGIAGIMLPDSVIITAMVFLLMVITTPYLIIITETLDSIMDLIVASAAVSVMVLAVAVTMDIAGHHGAILIALLLPDQEPLIQMFTMDQEDQEPELHLVLLQEQVEIII